MSTVTFPTLDDFAGSSTPLGRDLIVFGCSPQAGKAIGQYVREAGLVVVDADARVVEDITGFRRQLHKVVPGAVFIDVDALGSGMAVALATRVLRRCGPVQISELTLPAPSADPSAVGPTYLAITRDNALVSGLSSAA